MRESELIRFIDLPIIKDYGCLMFGQTPDQIPFNIKRVYSIFNVNPGFSRGFHAHKKTRQILFCLNSDIKVIVDDGKNREEVFLDTPGKGLFLDKMVWHEMHGFKSETILLVLASHVYDPYDYINDYQEFRKLAGGLQHTSMG